MIRKAIIVAAIVVAAIVLSIVASVVPVLAGDTVLGTKPFNFDFQHNGGLNSQDSSQAAFAFDGSKASPIANLKIVEASKDRDKIIYWPSVISDTIRVGSADSTAVSYDVHDASRLFLRIKGSFPDTSSAAMFGRLAIAVSGSYSSSQDTNSVATFVPRVHFGVVTDSLVYDVNAGTARTAYKAGSDEFEVVVRCQEGAYTYGSQGSIWIPLADSRGVYFWAPYIKVRVRLLATNYSSLVRQPSFTVDIIGTPVR